MWRVRDLLQDPGHPVETRTEARTYGVTRNVRVVVDVQFARGRVGRRRENDWSVAMTNHAVVIVGGLVTSTFLNLFLLPPLYLKWERLRRFC